MSKDYAIKVENVSKTFKLPHERHTSIKSSLINLRKRGYEKQQVLKNISFEVKKGEFFGIVGRNGSGKSTLLKLLSGIYVPDEGEIKIDGTLTPFIELGVGFNPELTGRENVFLNGALLGLGRKKMESLYDKIVDFAELARFMDQKLKNYSSGMQVRLAFSIAIQAKSDILVLDEVLAVGDAAFQQKCYDYFNSLKQDNRTIILVSHSMQIVDQFCERALLLEQGVVKEIGSSEKISGMYEEMFLREEINKMERERDAERKSEGDEPYEPIRLLEVEVLQGGKKTRQVKAKHPFSVRLKLRSDEEYKKVNVGVNIKSRDKVMVISTDANSTVGQLEFKKGETKTITFSIENFLTNGLYYVNLGVAEGQDVPQKVKLRKEHAQEFLIEGIDRHAGALIQPNIEAILE